MLRGWRPAGGRRPGGTALGRRHGPEPSRWDLRLERCVIVALGPAGSVAAVIGDAAVDLDGAFLAPGLIDAHVHLGIGLPFLAPGARDGGPTNGAEGAGLRRLEANLRATLAAGTTAVRNLGNVFAGDAQARMRTLGGVGAGDVATDGLGLPDAPLVVTAGRALTRKGRYGNFLGRGIDAGESATRALAEEAAAGARVIKLMLSGSVDFATGTVGPAHFESAEVRELVDAARALGVRVAAHANGPSAVRLAAEAGVDSIEHGILAGEAELELMAAAGVCWVPTLTPLHNLLGQGRWAVLPRVFEDHLDAVARGRELGVAIVAGTDSGSPGVPHSSLGTELALLGRAGLSPAERAGAATAAAARLLGLASGYGTLAVGSRTDLVWFARDPFAIDDPVPTVPLGWVRAGRVASPVALRRLLL